MSLAAKAETRVMTSSTNQVTATQDSATIHHMGAITLNHSIGNRTEVESLNVSSNKICEALIIDTKSNELIVNPNEGVVTSIATTKRETDDGNIVDTTSSCLPQDKSENIPDNCAARPIKRQKLNDVSSATDGVVESNADAVSTSAGVASATTPSDMNSHKPIAPSIASNNNSPSTSIKSTTQLLLPDYITIQQTVKDLLALLQLYGPLTANQLEYNLPPVPQATAPHLSWTIHDVLSILVAIGLVQFVSKTNQYCMFGGLPRATPIYPTDIPSEIQQAVHEAEDSFKRCKILRDALRSNVNNNNCNKHTTKYYKDVLKELLQDYPQILNDPVYYTALRNCNIDAGGGYNTNSISEKRHTAPKSSSNSNKGTNIKGTANLKETRSRLSSTKQASKIKLLSTPVETVATLNNHNNNNNICEKSIDKVSTDATTKLSLPTLNASTALLSTNPPENEPGSAVSMTTVSTDANCLTTPSISAPSKTDVTTITTSPEAKPTIVPSKIESSTT
jgi:hypothetical protein